MFGALSSFGALAWVDRQETGSLWEVSGELLLRTALPFPHLRMLNFTNVMALLRHMPQDVHSAEKTDKKRVTAMEETRKGFQAKYGNQVSCEWTDLSWALQIKVTAPRA